MTEKTFMPNNETKKSTLFKILIFVWILSVPFKNAVYQISVPLMILFFIIHLIQKKRVDILIDNFLPTKHLTIGFVGIIFAMLLSNILNLEYLDKKSWHTIYMFIFRYGVIFVILGYFYRLNFFHKKDIVIALFASFLLLLSAGIFQIFQEASTVFSTGIVGTLNNRNAFGLLMGMGVVLSLLLIEDKKYTGLFLVLLFSFFMLFSFSRSSWVASFFSSFILLAFNYQKIKKRHFIFLLIFLFFVFLLYLNSPSLQERFTLLMEGYSSQRTTLWLHTITLIKEQLIFGYGVDSWMNLSDAKIHLRYTDPHNMVLEILLYIGLVGLFASFFTIFTILKKIASSKNFILFPVASYFLVVTQFDFGAFYSKELLSFLTIFVFFVYADTFKATKVI